MCFENSKKLIQVYWFKPQHWWAKIIFKDWQSNKDVKTHNSYGFSFIITWTRPSQSPTALYEMPDPLGPKQQQLHITLFLVIHVDPCLEKCHMQLIHFQEVIVGPVLPCWMINAIRKSDIEEKEGGKDFAGYTSKEKEI